MARAVWSGCSCQLALRLLRLIVNIRLDRARATCRALGSMAHGCDRSSVAFTIGMSSLIVLSNPEAYQSLVVIYPESVSQGALRLSCKRKAL